MALSRSRVGAIATLSIVLFLALAGCAAPATDTDAGGTASASPSPSPDDTVDTDDGGEGEQTGTDGEADPSQARVRVGPAVDYGGPDGGDQGDAELIEAGVWCETIQVFWGGTVPEGVSFTFEAALIDRPGLQARGGACGSRAPDTACLGLTLDATEPSATCSLTVLPQADFQDGTGISFAGRLECPTAGVCDAVVARDVKRGPPIEVTTPPELAAEQDQQDQDETPTPDPTPQEPDEQAPEQPDPDEQTPAEDPDQQQQDDQG